MRSEKKGLQLIIPCQTFDSYRETAILIHYITRTDKRLDRENELISYGGHGVSISKPIETVIEEFNAVYSWYKPPRNGCNRHVFHEYVTLSKEYADLMSEMDLDELGYQLSSHYWNRGFQVVYGVHRPDQETGHFHIHFAVNAVSRRTGKKWRADGEENQCRCDLFNRLADAFLKEKNK